MPQHLLPVVQIASILILPQRLFITAPSISTHTLPQHWLTVPLVASILVESHRLSRAAPNVFIHVVPQHLLVTAVTINYCLYISCLNVCLRPLWIDLYVTWQHQGMDRPGVRQVPEGGGEQGKMEKTGCKIVCGAPTTLVVKGLMMMTCSTSPFAYCRSV